MGIKEGGVATAVIDRLGAGTAVAMGTALGAVAEQRGEGAILGHFGAFWGFSVSLENLGEFGAILANFDPLEGIWGTKM